MTDPQEPQGRFYLIYRELQILADPAVEIAPEELNEIDQIRKLVMEVNDERPVFSTLT